MLYQPPTYRLVSWPVRLVVLVIAIGGAWMMLEGWANGVRIAKIISAIGERQAAADAAALRAKQAKRAAEQAPGEPGVVYIQKIAPTAIPPVDGKGWIPPENSAPVPSKPH